MLRAEKTMNQPITDGPVDAVYPIVPNGPTVVILNEYSALYRVATRPPASLPEPSGTESPTQAPLGNPDPR